MRDDSGATQDALKETVASFTLIIPIILSQPPSSSSRSSQPLANASGARLIFLAPSRRNMPEGMHRFGQAWCLIVMLPTMHSPALNLWCIGVSAG